MLPELTNLLPEARKRQLRRDYFYRLATLSALMLALLIVIAGVLLIPTRTYLTQEVATRTQTLASLETTLASSDEQNLDTRLAALAEETTALGTLATSTTESATLAQLLAVAHPGIAFSAITIAGTAGSIAGVADTRDDLRAYYLALGSASVIKSASLPVSAYAVAANAPFTITLALP
jgi:Tfp pilus assembly protein PilN